jgi:RNA polymerase-binding transcription factor DksA
MASTERDALEGATRDDIFGELSGTDQHQADSGSETFERERDATILRIADEVVADIDHALAKLAAGHYGACETCGTAISDERLEARPEARFCEQHERMWELASISMDVPGLTKQVDDTGEPGWRELDGLPDDSGAVTDWALAPEEAALHVEESGGWTYPEDAEDVEDAEAAEGEAIAREDEGRRRTEDEERAQLDELERDEEALGR